MKKYLPAIFLGLVFFIGFSVLLYPSFSNYFNSKRQTEAIAGYEADLKALSKERHQEILKQAHQYNQAIQQSNIPDTSYDDVLSFSGSNVIAYIEIPKINLSLPIYRGTSEAVLQKGVGHLKEFSLPVGGSGTHSVLSAHRGLPSAKLFTDLDQITIGNTFTIHVLGEVLTYQVDDISTVEPHEVNSLQIFPGEDYVTLLTCTPYAVNTHRLLVRGKRIATPSGIPAATEDAQVFTPPLTAVLIAAPVFIILTAGYFIMRYVRKRNKNADRGKRGKSHEVPI